MRVTPSFVVSLAISTTISFAVPVITVGLFLGLAVLISLIPGSIEFGNQAVASILEFLAVFGSGKPVSGVVTLGLACSFVGVLFDLFNIYRFQSLRD